MGQRDIEIVKYKRIKIGIERSVGLYWIQSARHSAYYSLPPSHQRKEQGLLFQLPASTSGIPYSLH